MKKILVEWVAEANHADIWVKTSQDGHISSGIVLATIDKKTYDWLMKDN